MIEALAAPLMVKAIDFLFDEGKKILEERRLRRQAESAPANQQKAEQPAANVENAVPQTAPISKKQDAFSARIDESRLKSVEKDLSHLLEMCEIYKTNLYNAKEKYARFGRDYAPPHLLHEIKEYEDGFFDATEKLGKLLSYVYGKEIAIYNLE